MARENRHEFSQIRKTYEVPCVFQRLSNNLDMCWQAVHLHVDGFVELLHHQFVPQEFKGKEVAGDLSETELCQQPLVEALVVQ